MAEASSATQPFSIALAGNPNSGKTTLFNALTGLNQKTGNYPGVTVDKKTGHFDLGTKRIQVLDLPGAYSLDSRSQDEHVASSVLRDPNHTDHPAVVVYVADASNLKRSLLYFTQLMDAGVPTILALNMMDAAEAKGIRINTELLAQQLGVKVIPINARKRLGIDDIKAAIDQNHNEARDFLPKNERPANAKAASIARYKKLTQLFEESVSRTEPLRQSLTRRVDKILTHNVFGYVIFFGIMMLIFQAVFAWASVPMDLIDGGFADLGAFLNTQLPDAWYTSLLVDGIVAGLGGILIFVPQIAILFFFIAILEDTGYMARVSYLMDGFMRKMGLHGRSVIPLVSGLACAVPAIMAARTIGNWRERIITIMVTPFISCAARLPVYTLLIALVIPDKKIAGFLNAQGLTLMGLYLLGFFTALGASIIISRFLKTTERSFLMLEMPVYRAPRWGDIGLNIWEKVRVFVVDAGKVILAISIVLWALASYGPGDEFAQIEDNYAKAVSMGEISQDEANIAIASEQLEASYAGHIGKAIEPAIRPLGFDWKIGIALITSFAAREVFVGTMSTIYSVGEDDDEQRGIKDKLRAEMRPGTKDPMWTLPVGIALMLFYAFAMQCMSTLAIVYRETKSIKWPALQLIMMTVLAYLSSLIAFQVLS